MKRLALALMSLAMLAVTLTANAQTQTKTVKDQLGSVAVKPVSNTKPVQVPYITWGGDIAAFLANGNSLRTKPDSIYGKLGLDLQFVNGDDTFAQTKRYLSGESPYWRGTFRMGGQFSEALNASPETKPVCILRLTWSLGDHLVATDDIKMLQDLKGATVIFQRGGPHVGLVDDTLRAADLKWSDITAVEVDDLTGDNGPAEAFRKAVASGKKKVVACVITPDMIGLCSGLESVGSGAEGTVKGSHVVNTTSTMSRSIADVWWVRADYLKDHRDEVEKFVAGYLKATVELVKMRNNYESGADKGSFTKGTGPQYKAALTFAQTTFGADVLPTLEEDAHGLLLDAEFAGLPGQISFFEDEGNLNNFDKKLKVALDLATQQGYAKSRAGFDTARWDYRRIAEIAGIEYKKESTSGRIQAESLNINPDADFGDKTIYSFTINFDPNQTTFSSDRYGTEFQRALEQASTFGNAVILIRGHSDTNLVLAHLVRAGLKKGIIKRTGGPGNRQYFLNGKPLDLNSTSTLVKLISSGAFDGDNEYNPREKMQAALSLSQTRAENVAKAVEAFAKVKGVTLDATQLQPLGVGINDPLIGRPTGPQDSLKNMRVEFSIIRVPAESVKPADYDF